MATCVRPLAKLFTDLNKGLGEHDLRNIRNLVKGDPNTNEPIPASVLETLKTPLDIFNYLEDHGYIAVDNLGFLQDILKNMNKLPLLKKVNDFKAAQRGNTAIQTETSKGHTGSNLKRTIPGQDDVTERPSKRPRYQSEGGNKNGATSDKHYEGTNWDMRDSTDSNPCHVDTTETVQETTKGSVLILNDEWGTSKGGISSVHRCIAQQAKNAGFDVHVTAFDATNNDKEDAHSRGVNVIMADKAGSCEPNFDWLKMYHTTHFPTLSKIKNVKAIIGHVPITSRAALNIKKDCFPNARTFLFNHILPQATDMYKEVWDLGQTEVKLDDIVKEAEEADVVFSVGPMIFEEYETEYKGADYPNEITHKEFLPLPDDEFFKVNLQKPDTVFTPQVLTVGRVDKDKLKGIDIAVDAMSSVAEVLYDAKASEEPTLWVRGIQRDKQKQSTDFIDEHTSSGHLRKRCHLYGTQDQIRKDLKKCNLFIMPSRCEPFGMVALEAMATGLPTLVTSNSGAAKFLKRHFKQDSRSMVVEVGVNDQKSKENVEAWKLKIIDILRENYSVHFENAQAFKEKLQNEDSPIRVSLHEFKTTLTKCI
ncbi:uncharacterized protein LOC144452828 [Glandiceps talaboti]